MNYIILVFYYLFGLMFFVFYNFYYRQRNVEGILVDSDLLHNLMNGNE